MTEQEFAEAYKEYFPATIRYVQKLGKNPTSTEDIAQEAWARAWEKRAMFRGECRISSWVTSIARNIAFYQFRRVNPDQFDKQHDFGELQDFDTRIDVDLLLKHCDVRGDKRQLLEEWSEGHSIQDISDRRGIPTSTTKMRLFHTWTDMRRYLGRENKN